MGKKGEKEKERIDLFYVGDGICVNGEIEDDDENRKGEADGNIQPFDL